MRASELAMLLMAKVEVEGDGIVVDCAWWSIIDVVRIEDGGIATYDFVSAPE